MVRAVRMFRHDLCRRLYSLSAWTMERSHVSLFLCHDWGLPNYIYILEILQGDEMAGPWGGRSVERR